MTYGIVIASYRYGHLAAHCIETVLEQTKPFDKIWFVDDGVGDCGHLPKLYPQVNYTLREKNMGTVTNFQDMLERVDTDMVMFLGADNWLRSDTLEQLKKSQADIVMYDGMVVGTEKDWARRYFKSKEYQGGYYWDRKGGHHGSMLYNVEKAKTIGYHCERTNGNTLEDLNLFDKLKKQGATIEHIAEPLLYYRRHKGNYNPCS